MSVASASEPCRNATSGVKSLYNASASATPFEFTVAIDKSQPVAVLHDASVLLDGLAIGQRHRVAIRQVGKPSASFAFSFAEYGSNDLCLWFGPFYESWSLWPSKQSKGKCACGAMQHGA